MLKQQSKLVKNIFVTEEIIRLSRGLGRSL